MNEPVIRLNKISKDFYIYDKPLDRLLENFLPNSKRHKKFKALSNINFEIKKGETVGLVGANGAGKSTLLQIICGTLNATEGEVIVDGRISALLELGSGFNPEFTGRENIYFFSAMQGMKKKEIEDKMEDILAFADIDEFIDQPVKTYSSGMYVRLAFSAAIHVEPDILVVDEALAVGDEAFQNKCYSKINAMRDAGVTVLFVTHSPQTVMSLCDRALFFDHGELLLDGNPKDVISSYQKILYAPQDKKRELIQSLKDSGVNAFKSVLNDKQEFSSTKKYTNVEEYYDNGLVSEPVIYEKKGIDIIDPHIELFNGQRVNVLVKNRDYYYKYQVKALEDVSFVRFSMVIKILNGTELGGYISGHSPYTSIKDIKKGEIYDVSFKFNSRLNGGVYIMNSGVRGMLGSEEEFLNRILDAAMFRVLPLDEEKGTCFIDFDIECEFKEVLDV
ncbi:ABC transporter ATP-binding protein [Vibrio fluvialis]|nr:ABC transporter ATP-binding protein [Vibrio fluvialis]